MKTIDKLRLLALAAVPVIIAIGISVDSGSTNTSTVKTPPPDYPAPTEAQKKAGEKEVAAVRFCKDLMQNTGWGTTEYDFASCMWGRTSNQTWMDAMVRLQRQETMQSLAPPPSYAPPVSQDYAERTRESNQRIQDRVDRQDDRAMRQMQRSERFDNRLNAENFRRGGR